MDTQMQCTLKYASESHWPSRIALYRWRYTMGINYNIKYINYNIKLTVINQYSLFSPTIAGTGEWFMDVGEIGIAKTNGLKSND